MTERIPDVTLGDRLFAAFQYVLPKQLLSRVIYSVMRSESPAFKRLLLGAFLKGYRVNMAEAVQSDPFAYRSFNDFFTRALRPGARTIAPGADVIVSPVDGTVSQAGAIHDRAIIQAKGIHYTTQQLLTNEAAAQAYRNGSFACIYLAPYNYHRIHMPFAGRLLNTLYVPGDLFSVNAATARAVPGVFARNERVICEFETAVGRMAVILVGALFVGSMETVYAGEINPPPRGPGPRAPRASTQYFRSSPEGDSSRPKRGVVPISQGVGQTFAKGAELGRFNMGSTVVLLFQENRVRWEDFLEPQATVQMGGAIGTAKP
jgi:phosphatidylserine decarboxylase